MGNMTGLKARQNEQRKIMRENIDATIRSMRKGREKITITSLADALDVSRSTLYAPYIQAHLMNYPEFNPDVKQPEYNEEQLQTLQNQVATLKAEVKELTRRIKTLKAEYKASNVARKELAEQYEQLLGRYQADVGEKIVHF